MTKKIICLLLIISMALFTLCACKGSADTSSDEVSLDENADALVPHLGKTRYDGKTLRILCMFQDVPFGTAMFGADELTGEPVNDACFERIQKLKSEYGFDIEATFEADFPSFVSRLKADFQSGEVEYDCAFGGATALTAVAENGVLKDINTIKDSHLRLDEPWWDTFAAEGMTLKGRLFCITGDIVVLDDENTNCIFYNKDLINDHPDLENPSELALAGKWTVDKMYEMMKTVATSDGEGDMDVYGKDVWGLMGKAFTLHTLISGCNSPITNRTEDGTPILAMMEQRNVDVFDKCFEIMTDPTCATYLEKYFAWNEYDKINNIYNTHFYAGRCLFFPGLIQTVNTDAMRNSNIKYGILPYPKYDLEQTHYANPVEPYQFGCVSIVRNCKDTDFVTFALEALAYTGRSMVTPEYYDRTLKNKRFLDDNDSPEMLDLIFSERLLDLSIIYNWGDCIQYYNNMLWNKKGLSSYYEEVEGAFNSRLNETLEQFEKLTD